MRLYAAVAALGFRRYATYRVATLAGVFTNTRLRADHGVHLHRAVEGAAAPGRLRRSAQAVTYVWLGQALLTAMALLGGGFEDGADRAHPVG